MKHTVLQAIIGSKSEANEMNYNIKNFLRCILIMAALCYTDQQLSQNITDPKQLYANTSEAVVVVYSFDKEGDVVAAASGVIVSADGLIFTNFHVIEYANEIKIRKGTDTYSDVKIIALNRENDAAILKADLHCSEFIKIGCSDSAMIGETVYTIGNPNSLERSLSSGLLSGKRTIENKSLLQITASISHGSSGGALLNSNGELIGITSSSFEGNQNLNFAVPVTNYIKMLFINTEDNNLVSSMDTLCRKYLMVEDCYEDEADSLLRSIAARCCDKPGSFSELGRYAFSLLYDELALEYYSMALSADTSDKQLYLQRGICYSIIGELDSALIDFETALKLDPQYTQVFLSRAERYMQVSSYAEAIADYTEAIKLEPGDYSLYTLRAECYLQNNDTALALKDLKRSIGTYRYDYQYVQRAEIYEKLGMLNQAIEDYTSAICINNNPWWYFSRGILYSKIGNSQYAAADFLVYLAKEPKSAFALNNLAYCYLNQGEHELAEKNFNYALENDENHFDAYLGLSVLYYRQKKLTNSLKAMTRAIHCKGLLEEGINGLHYLKESGYFWNKDEEKDLIRIFGIMGLDTKLNKRKVRSFRVSAQIPK